MTSVDSTDQIDNQIVLLSREVRQVEDVFSFVGLVEEKLGLGIALTLILCGSDGDTKREYDQLLNIKLEPDLCDEESTEIQENPLHESESHSDSEENPNDPIFDPEKKEKIKKTKSPKRKLDVVQKEKKVKIVEEKKVIVKVKKQGSLAKDTKRLCTECGKIYASQNHLTRHKKATHLKEKKSYTCPICKHEESYLYYTDFFKHKQRCEAKLPEFAERYVCSICGAKYGTWYDWKNHHYVCSGYRPRSTNCKPTLYKCNHENCDYQTRRKIRLTNHTNTVHLNLPPIREHTCEECGKAFEKRETLKNHLKTVHQELRPHHCTQCTSSFKTIDILRRHMKIHSDICGSICPYCGKGFKQSATLYRHKITCPANPNKRIK